jgi:hypothetical protein
VIEDELDSPLDESQLDEELEVRELPDGSFSYQPEGMEGELEEGEDERPQDFYENLAANLPESVLTAISSELLEDVESDLDSRQEWEKTVDIIFGYLGYKGKEFRTMPFLAQACAAFDSTLSSALLRLFAVARSELLPASGPVRMQVMGAPSPESEEVGERVKMFMNNYLTAIDREYYADFERMLLFAIFFGCAFKKVYQDPVLNRPLARFITPYNLIIDQNTTSVLDSSRITEILSLSRREVLLRQKSGDFVEFTLAEVNEEDDQSESQLEETIKSSEGVTTKDEDNKNLFKFYEIHCERDASQIEGEEQDDHSIPKPYIITIDITTKKVVSMRRNWKEGDTAFKKRNYYVHYYALAGFGIYGLGLAQILGSNAISLTSILRQTIDAASLKNSPGGFIKKGVRIENNDQQIGVASWHQLDTKNVPFSECFMPMPYSEPSGALIELRQQLKEECFGIISALETKIPELGANAPVGTTLAILDVATQIESCIMRSFNVSLGYELTLLYNLFGEYLPDTPYPFAVPGSNYAVMKQDFSDGISIIPVSDPNALTSTHRLIRNDAIMKVAMSAPEMHDMHEVLYRMYSSMNVPNIEKILKPPPKPVSLDPMTENMMIMAGTPVTASSFQDDDSHITAHKALVGDPRVQADPRMFTSISIHIQEHKCLKVYKEMQKQQMAQQMQMQLSQAVSSGMMPPEMADMQLQQQMQSFQPPEIPPEQVQEIMKVPEVQNRVAMQDAQETIMQQQQQQEQMANQLDINKVAMADVEQKREAAHLKSEEMKQRIEADVLKTNLQYESEMAKIQSQRETAREKHEVDLMIARNKEMVEYDANAIKQRIRGDA